MHASDSMTDDVLILYDDAMLEHRPEGWDPDRADHLSDAIRALLDRVGVPEGRWAHPERPERLTAICDLLRAQPVDGTRWARPAPAPRDALERVHRRDYVDRIEGLRGCSELLDPDTTLVSPGSVDAAHIAAGAAVGVAEAVASGEAKRAFALVRPPGHHAESNRARGFCLYNNVAVAAAHARARLGCERVLIIDWDAHHGNGTQEIFYADPAVLFFDTHRGDGLYPGTGSLDETGSGPGVGSNLNVPLPDGSGDATLLTAFEEILAPAADRFQPDMVLVSAGFDAHEADLAMQVTEAGFAAMCGFVRDLADRHAGGRLALVLEGGYNTEPLARNVRACLEVLAGATPPTLPRTEEPGLIAVRDAAAFHAPHLRV